MCSTGRLGGGLEQEGTWVQFVLWLHVARASRIDCGTAAKPRLVQSADRRVGRQKCSVGCFEVVPDRRRHNPPGLVPAPTNRLTLALNTQTALALAPTSPPRTTMLFAVSTVVCSTRERPNHMSYKCFSKENSEFDASLTLASFASRQYVAKPKVKQGAFPTPKQTVADALLDPAVDEADLA